MLRLFGWPAVPEVRRHYHPATRKVSIAQSVSYMIKSDVPKFVFDTSLYGGLIFVCNLKKNVFRTTALWAYYFPSWDGTVILTPARMSYFSSGVPSI